MADDTDRDRDGGCGGEVSLECVGRGLERVDRATEEEARSVVSLNLDDNHVHRLDGIDSYLRLETLSICKNNLVRMHGVGRLTSLRYLNLSNNALLTIEGLKELVYLKRLELACNNIKSIEHLNNNVNLEYLDLSGNQITHLSDISYLKNLKHLYLDKNGIGNLRQGERYLPPSLISLGISHNYLTDLNSLCHLAHLGQLESISIEGNPCVVPTGSQEKVDFDYRPFVINWVMNVKTVDGFEVTPIESLKAEWLYSQGQGRKYREGEHEKLVEYLYSICPKGDTAPETEDQKKLQLILSKAQHHQQQLREQGPSPQRAKHSPRMHARLSGRLVNKSPDNSMSSSFHATLSNKHHDLLSQQTKQMSASFSGDLPSNHPISTKSVIPTRIINETISLMNQSLDPPSGRMAFGNNDSTPRDIVVTNGIILEKNVENINKSTKSEKELANSAKDTNKEEKQKIDSNLDNNKCLNQPLEAASKMVPVPDSLMSPDYQGPLFATQSNVIVNQNPHAPNRRNNANFSPGCQIPSVQTYSPGVPVKNVTSSTPTTNCEPKKVPHKSPGAGRALAPGVRNSAGSPQVSRSAMSSPKSRNNKEQRKGSFSSRPTQNNEDNIQSAKNLYNQSLQQTTGKVLNNTNNAANKKMNGSHKTVSALSNQMEIQVTPPDSRGANSSDDDSEMCAEKLQSIRDAANQRRQKQSVSDSVSSDLMGSITNKSSKKTKTAQCAAVMIQKIWRGYRTRNLNQKAGNIMHSIQTMRTRQYIEKLSNDMEATKAALDSERKIQQLQMQAINALWKKISAMEVTSGKGDDKIDTNLSRDILSFSENMVKSEEKSVKDEAVRELTHTCSMLQSQVQQLQGSMRDILMLVSGKRSPMPDLANSDGIATQTEISAVHTPQGEISGVWPYQKAVSRPCSLSLTVQNNNFKKSESVQSDEKMKDQAISSIEKEILLPGQVDKHTVSSKDEKSIVDKKSNDLLQEIHIVNSGGDHFIESLKKECLGVEKALLNQEKS